MKAMLDELGIEIDLSGLRPGMSREEFAAKAAEMAATIKDRAEEPGRAFRQPERRKNKRQLEKEERLRQTEAIRKKSIATIYKELAKALHPDLEPDPGRRERKVVLMQELTGAYRNNDLHTSLRLELEWIEPEEGNVERLTEEKFRHPDLAGLFLVVDEIRMSRKVDALRKDVRDAINEGRL